MLERFAGLVFDRVLGFSLSSPSGFEEEVLKDLWPRLQKEGQDPVFWFV